MGESTHGYVRDRKRQICYGKFTIYFIRFHFLCFRDMIVSRLWLNSGRIARFGESGQLIHRRAGLRLWFAARKWARRTEKTSKSHTGNNPPSRRGVVSKLETMGQSTTPPARHESQSLKQLNVLFVLQQGTVQAGQAVFAVTFQILGAQIFGQQQFQPIQHFAG
jgi:hypothetical protein